MDMILVTNSKSQVGGVGLYLANKLEFSRKTDLDISHNGIVMLG